MPPGPAESAIKPRRPRRRAARSAERISLVSGILLWRTIHSSFDGLSELECCNLMVNMAKASVITASKIGRFILSIFVSPAAICAKKPAKR
jgi:hypothetical protein